MRRRKLARACAVDEEYFYHLLQIHKAVTTFQIFKYSAAIFLLAFCPLNTGCSPQIAPVNSAKSLVSQSQPLTQADLRASVLKETQPGGRLDFFTSIKGHEYDGAQIKPGVYSTLGHIALYKWGRAVKEMGVENVEDAYAIFSEFKSQPIGQRDKDYIKTGFRKEL